MNSLSRCSIAVYVLFLSLTGCVARAQSAHPTTELSASSTSAQISPSSLGTLQGHISDPTGALIPGVHIRISTVAGQVIGNVEANAAGGYQVRGLAADSYVIEATYDGFAPFVSHPIVLATGLTKTIDIKMAVESADVQVIVSDEATTGVSTEAGANTNAIVLKDKDLDALSDDPDELENELDALAGPSAGPNGGQIYIDGFTGGQLPPKSSIREIRINQNPYSAEFDRIGYGRIEILTKPGTDTLHARFYGQGNDNIFNTGNPFTKVLPSYYSYQYNGTVSGALSKRTSYFFSVEDRETQNDNIYSILGGPLYDAATNTYSVSTGPVAGSLLNPSNRFNVSPRLDLQLGQKNTLTIRYQFFRNKSTDNLGGSTSFPSLASSSNSMEHSIQLDDTQLINDHLANETRFNFRRSHFSSSPKSTAPAYSVPGVFSGGGNGSQFSNSHTDHLELQNVTTFSHGAQAIKFGTWLRDDRQALWTNGGFNGNFTFPSVTAFVETWNGVATGKTFDQIAAACPATQAGGCLPIKLTYKTGPNAFSANVFNAAIYFQDDWKVNKYLTLSGGLRWESQNHIADHSDWSPRFAFAYALDGHKKGTVQKTILRGGFGFFFDRFSTGNLMNLEMLSGATNSQTQTIINNPNCFNATSLNSISGGVATCGTGAVSAPAIYSVANNYHSPYMEQTSMSLERQVTKATTLTFTYTHSSGFHQLVVRNANAFLPGTFAYGSATLTGTRPDPSQGIVLQYYPEGFFNENQINVNLNARFSPRFTLTGFYSASWANSDGSGGSNPSNSYNLRQDWGHATFVRPQWLNLTGNFTVPWGITLNPFLVAQAGHPYNITSPYDLSGDNFFNNRPSYAVAATAANQTVQTEFGALNVVPPQSGESLIPINMGNSPASIAVNLRLSRSFGIGPRVTAPGEPQQQGGRPGGMGALGGPGGAGPMGGGPGGGGMRGGGFGGGRGGMRGNNNSGHKYTLNINMQALNLFNNINRGTPSGSIQPTFNASTGLYGPGAQFGKSSSLAGGMFSTASAARRIFIQAAFQF